MAEPVDIETARNKLAGASRKRSRGPSDAGSWDAAIEQVGYSPDKFYPQTEGGKTRNFAVPDQSGYRIDALIASGIVPTIKTFGDFARDAIAHRLHYWEEHVKDTPADLGPMLAVMRWRQVLADKAGYAKEMREGVDEFQRLLLDAQSDRDANQLAALIRETEEQLDDFEEPYHSRIKTLTEQAKVALKGMR